MINFKMNNGNTIPALGYGVFQMTGDEVRQHLPEAIELGFRHIDTANAYFNEVAVGEVVKASDIARDEFFVTRSTRTTSVGGTSTKLSRVLAWTTSTCCCSISPTAST